MTQEIDGIPTPIKQRLLERAEKIRRSVAAAEESCRRRAEQEKGDRNEGLKQAVLLDKLAEELHRLSPESLKMIEFMANVALRSSIFE